MNNETIYLTLTPEVLATVYLNISIVSKQCIATYIHSDFILHNH